MKAQKVGVLLLCCLLVFSGCAAQRPSPIQPFISPEPMENTVTITLYFADKDAMDVTPERRDVLRKNEPLEVIVLRELINGPQSPETHSTLPAETKLISVDVVDRIAYANFSRELVTRHPGGSTGERMTIMSIVYTLTELPGIEKVQLLLEGEKKEVMFGHGITIDPIGRPEPQLSINSVDPQLTGLEPWLAESPPLAGNVVALGVGKVTGSELDLVAFAGGELYIFEYDSRGFQLIWNMALDRHITAITSADLTGDGRDELILAGAVSGNYNPNVPGFIAVYTWQEGSLIKLTDVSRETTPFWGTAAMDVTGDSRPEVLVSNGNAMFIFEWQDVGLQQIHAVTRFSGTISNATFQGVERLAWRDANGTSVGVFYWGQGEWATVFRSDGQGEWTDSVPSYGDLTGDGRYELAILDLGGFLNVFDDKGHRILVDSSWQEIFASDSYVSRPIIVNIAGTGYLVFGLEDYIRIRPWQ